jgi:ClpP class serine protease
MSSVAQAILDTPWAMSDEGLHWLMTLCDLDLSALASLPNRKPADTHRSVIRDGIGIVPVHGPLFKKSNFWTDLFGASGYDQIHHDISVLAKTPGIKAIVLDIDSPGGEASGVGELAESIYQLRGKIPVHAYIGGTGASAAFWIASAAQEIHASPSAIIGSIGVQTAIRSGKNPNEIRFVSAQSPNKNRDPATEGGAAEVQRVINDLATVFIEQVARNRSITSEAVQNNYGQGSVFVGASALRQGLADNLTTFEDLMSKVAKTDPAVESRPEATKDIPADLAEHFMALGRAEERSKTKAAILEDRKRAEEIRGLCHGRTSPEFCQSLIDSDLSAEQASYEILKRGLQTRKSGIELLKESEDSIEMPSAKPEPSADSDILEQHLKMAKTMGLRVRA